MYMHENRKVSQDFNEAVLNMVKLQDKESSGMKIVVREKVDKTEGLLIAMSVIALVLGFVTALMMGRMIAMPLKKIALAAGRISKGDFSGNKLAVKSNDELGILAGAFNEMRSSVKEMVRGMVDISTKMSHSIGNLSWQAGQTAAAATENASTISQSYACPGI